MRLLHDFLDLSLSYPISMGRSRRGFAVDMAILMGLLTDKEAKYL